MMFASLPGYSIVNQSSRPQTMPLFGDTTGTVNWSLIAAIGVAGFAMFFLLKTLGHETRYSRG